MIYRNVDILIIAELYLQWLTLH